MEKLTDIEKLFEWQITFSSPITEEKLEKLYNKVYFDNTNINVGDTILKFISDGKILYTSRGNINSLDLNDLLIESSGFIPSFGKKLFNARKLETILRKELVKIEHLITFEFDRYYGELTIVLYNSEYAYYIEETIERVKPKLFYIDLKYKKEIMNTIPQTVLYDFRLNYNYNEVRKDIARLSKYNNQIIGILDKNADYLNSNKYELTESEIKRIEFEDLKEKNLI